MKTLPVGLFGASYANAVMSDHPLGYWRFAELSGTTAFDSSGNGNNGTYSGAVGGAKWTSVAGATAAIGGPGIQIAADNTSFVTLSSSTFAFTGATPFSLEGWFRATGGQVVAGPGATLFSVNGTGNQGYDVFIAGGGVGNVTRFYLIGGTTATHFIEQDLSVVGDYTDGDWHHQIITYSGSGLASGVGGYLDGVAMTFGTTQKDTFSGSAASATPLLISARNDAFAYFKTGAAIDECAIYTYVLSAAQAKKHYNAARNI